MDPDVDVVVTMLLMHDVARKDEINSNSGSGIDGWMITVQEKMEVHRSCVEASTSRDDSCPQGHAILKDIWV